MSIDALFQTFPLRSASWRSTIESTIRAQDDGSSRLEKLLSFLHPRRGRLLPSPPQVFAALDLTPPEDVKVIVIGQDPYPTPGDAHGLAFSVQRCDKLPRSLRNIFTEIERDTGHARCSGDLSDWARQGVLLLNTVLTFEHAAGTGPAVSHRGRGWEDITMGILRTVYNEQKPVVLLVWGQKAASMVDACGTPPTHVLRLQSTHPSPLSYRRSVPGFSSFMQCGHFSATNRYLREHGCPEICWWDTEHGMTA